MSTASRDDSQACQRCHQVNQMLLALAQELLTEPAVGTRSVNFEPYGKATFAFNDGPT